MTLGQHLEGKRVRLTDIDGKVFTGKVTDYVYPEDNEPEDIDCIIIRDDKTKRSIGFNNPEIKSIDILSEK